ncbi:hypothetical protein GCM10007973_10510 [Polymorphobacter multimanifer]|uniref:Uncharacterized protein n=1 Tax=Polymorphobacter multimanifer TaxID=1070431 RepID=A0A841LHC2_9SPHN|nr:hypothetical protein [Polymorphobacter multimanifer]MBB6228368.1 hypothetical protein [Polymorphobacter multimanifer]GGI75498.1 hypothetical protein GCM10007973_10510 [Polymorphobacter multimanifer]
MRGLGRLLRGLTTAKDGTTPSVIRIWGLAFALIDLAMSMSFLALVWMAAGGRVAMGFDVMSAAQGFGLLMAAHWAGLAGFAAALRWQASVTAGNDFGGIYGRSDGSEAGAGLGVEVSGGSADAAAGGVAAGRPGGAAGGPGAEGWGGGAG